MSQSSQLIRLCMPLTKFSYANTPAGSTGPIPWTHMSSTNNLFVLIEPSEVQTQQGVLEKRYRFKVLQDPNVHEDFDLSLLAQEAQRALCEAKTSLLPEQQPSITIIVRSPCIAMRYPLQERQIRRFQVRFAKEEDYYETLRVLSTVKVPFVEAGTIPKQQVMPASNLHTKIPGSTTSKYTKQNNSEPQTHFLQTRDYSSAMTNTAGQGDAQQRCTATHRIGNATFPPTQSRSVNQYSGQPPGNAFSDFRSLAPKSNISSTDFSHSTLLSASQTFPATYALPSSSISTYIPRPSTAPISLGLSNGSDLPPKRDLPFQRKSKMIPPAEVVGDDTHTAQTANTGAIASEASLPAVSIAPVEQVAVAKGRKRAAPKARKAPAVKKPRTSTARKKGAVNKTQEDQAVPSVEELLQRDDSQSRGEPGTQQHIDTQALLDNAEAIQIARQTRSKTNRDKSSAMPRNYSRGSTESTNNHRSGEQRITRKATYHTRSQSANIRRHTPPTQISNESEQPQDGRRQESTPLDHQDNNAGQPGAQNIPPAQPTTQPQKSALALLMQDPNFAQPATITLPNPAEAQPTSTTTHTNFDDLSESDRHAALEAWMIQNLRDESFLNLCKSLNGVWQRVFVDI